jgi:peptidoglycan hydrolase-like protein with peptidoglycan-binding domain
MQTQHMPPPRRFRSATFSGLLFLSAAVALTACALGEPTGAEGQSSGEGATFAQELAAGRDLNLGMQGQDVRAVQEHLRQFGYFPNPELARADAGWRPVVASSPATWGTFDAVTGEGVRAFQTRHGLKVTGVVDGPTRAQIAQPRCGMPESAFRGDSRDKFALEGKKWTLRRLTWRLDAVIIPGTNATRAKEAIRGAFLTLARATDLQFGEATSGETPNIVVRVANLGSCSNPAGGNVLARGFFPDGKNTQGNVQLNSNCQFWRQNSETDTIPASSLDLETVLLHEFGHGLGLDHSTRGPNVAAMFPSGERGVLRRGLHEDDKIPLGTLYNPWRLVSGCAIDIGGGADGSVWMIGCDWQNGAGGSSIYKLVNGEFEQERSLGRANFIAVGPDGIPWVVNSFGEIYRRSSKDPFDTTGWEFLPGSGCAWDIAVGAEGSAWVIGCDDVPGGHSIFKWNGSGWDKTNDNGAADRIAVDSIGRPWVVNRDGEVFTRSTDSVDTGEWIHWNRHFGGVKDIGIMRSGPDNTDYAWMVSNESSTSANVYVWERQDPEFALGGDLIAPARAGSWFRDGSGLGDELAVRVTVATTGGRSTPWVLDRVGNIFTKQR